MRIAVTRIQPTEETNSYMVDIIIDGSPRTFKLDVEPVKNFLAVRPDVDFDAYLGATLAASEVAGVLIRYHKGEQLDLPIDLGDFERWDPVSPEERIERFHKRRTRR